MHLLNLVALWVCVTAVEMGFMVDSKDDYNDIVNWINGHKPIMVETLDDLEIKDLFKRGSAVVKSTKTLIVPDGDLVDIQSFVGTEKVVGEVYDFAEYDFKDSFTYLEVQKKSFGSILDNSKSLNSNSILFSIGSSGGTTGLLIASLGVSLIFLTNFEAELDLSSQTSQSKSISCKVPPGARVGAASTAEVSKIANVNKRLVHIELQKSFKDCALGLLKFKSSHCTKHDYSYVLGDWESTELEYTNRLNVECVTY